VYERGDIQNEDIGEKPALEDTGATGIGKERELNSPMVPLKQQTKKPALAYQ